MLSKDSDRPAPSSSLCCSLRCYCARLSTPFPARGFLSLQLFHLAIDTAKFKHWSLCVWTNIADAEGSWLRHGHLVPSADSSPGPVTVWVCSSVLTWSNQCLGELQLELCIPSACPRTGYCKIMRQQQPSCCCVQSPRPAQRMGCVILSCFSVQTSVSHSVISALMYS